MPIHMGLETTIQFYDLTGQYGSVGIFSATVPFGGYLTNVSEENAALQQ
jgi:hypothetical protein